MELLNKKCKTFVESRLETHYDDLLAQGLGIHEVLRMYLYPITSIHLHPSENWEIEAGGSALSVYIFSFSKIPMCKKVPLPVLGLFYEHRPGIFRGRI